MGCRQRTHVCWQHARYIRGMSRKVSILQEGKQISCLGLQLTTWESGSASMPRTAHSLAGKDSDNSANKPGLGF